MSKEKISLEQRRNMLIKNSIIMLVLLVVIFFATMSWFTVRKSYNATGISIQTEDPEIIQFAVPLDDGSYPTDDDSYLQTISLQEDFVDILSYFDKDVTSNGLNFYLPTLKYADSGLKVVDTDEGWTRATANEDYISVVFYARSTNKNVFIKSNSYLSTTADVITSKVYSGEVDNTTYDRQSSYGNFSTDGIVGAMRVSLVENDLNDTTSKACKFLWVPRPDVYLEGTTKSLKLHNDILTTTTGINGLTQGDTYKHYYYYPVDNPNSVSGTGMSEEAIEYADAKISKVEQQDDYTGYTPELGEEVQVSNGTKVDGTTSMETVTMDNGTQYYVYKYTLNIWIEGTDAEARRALNGGEFSLLLNFSCHD